LGGNDGCDDGGGGGRGWVEVESDNTILSKYTGF